MRNRNKKGQSSIISEIDRHNESCQLGLREGCVMDDSKWKWIWENDRFGKMHLT
jgi:hypothetical protein